MARPKGICAICGRGGKLTFEHVPPRCAFNSESVEGFRFTDWLDAGEDSTKLAGGHPQPHGTGYVTLCDDCNRRLLGGHYVPDFCKWVSAFADSIRRELPTFDTYDKEEDPWVRVSLEKTRPLPFVKQVIAMMLAMNGEAEPGFREAHSALVEFVRDPALVGVPAGYQVYICVYLGPLARFVPLAAKGAIGQPPTVFSALDYPPLAYVLTYNEPGDFLPCGKITHFAMVSADRRANVEIDMLVGFGHTALPGDYRTAAAIAKDQATGARHAWQHVERLCEASVSVLEPYRE